MKVKATLYNFRLFFGGFLLLVVTGTVMLLSLGKTSSFISLNSFHPHFLNVFFTVYTQAGDGLFAVCLIALFYLLKKPGANALLFSFLTSGIAAQIIKHLYDTPRPKLFFAPGQYNNFVEGVTLANHSGFPSGHTATAFALATVLVLMMKDKKSQLPLLAVATLVGYSRIYLAQHFLLDVMAGAIIGTAAGIWAVSLTYNWLPIQSAIRKLLRLKPTHYTNTPENMQAG